MGKKDLLANLTFKDLEKSAKEDESKGLQAYSRKSTVLSRKQRAINIGGPVKSSSMVGKHVVSTEYGKGFVSSHINGKITIVFNSYGVITMDYPDCMQDLKIV